MNAVSEINNLKAQVNVLIEEVAALILEIERLKKEKIGKPFRRDK